jgi:23S rRNA-/tRNA-specific pseudouridylate synthase
MAMAYAHRDLYLVHRLDRRVSGVLLFAKTKPDAAHLAKQWEARKVKKILLRHCANNRNSSHRTIVPLPDF